MFPPRRLRPLLFAALLLSGSAVAEKTSPPALASSSTSAEIPFERYTLDNGLKVILSPDSRLPRVAVNIWYHVGPVNEPAHRSGFAHLFEHLMFEGSANVGHEFDNLMESMGASSVNGTTNWDRTNYYETVPSEHLETALWIESDRMAFMALSPARLEAQRDIVKNERRQSFENVPYGMSDLTLLDTLFPKSHPYHGAVIGSMEDLSRARMEDVHQFYQTYYAPNNATLALVGDFDPALVKPMIAKYFSEFQARPVPASSHGVTPPLTAPVRQSVTEDVDLARIALGWIAPPAFSDADAALRVSAAILALGKSARLYRKLVVETKLATEVNAYVDANRLATIFGVEAKARTGAAPDALERELRQSLAALAAQGPSAEELGRAKRMLLVELFATLEHLNGDDGESGRAGLLQRFSYYRDDPGYLPTWTRALDSVSAGDVQAAVKQWLDPNRSVTVLTVPKPAAAPAPAGAK